MTSSSWWGTCLFTAENNSIDWIGKKRRFEWWRNFFDGAHSRFRSKKIIISKAIKNRGKNLSKTALRLIYILNWYTARSAVYANAQFFSSSITLCSFQSVAFYDFFCSSLKWAHIWMYIKDRIDACFIALAIDPRLFAFSCHSNLTYD